MKPYPLFFLVFLIAGCFPIKKAETPMDSTQVIADSLPATVVSENPPEPDRNFPYFAEEVLTEDRFDSSLTKSLNTLLFQYDTAKLYTMKTDFSVTYTDNKDPEDKTDVSESESKTWYYDKNYDLVGYSIQSESWEGNPSNYMKLTIIEVFSDRLLSGYYEYRERGGQMVVTSRTKIVPALCPKCGLNFNEGMGSGFDITKVDSTYVSILSSSFFKEYETLRSWLATKKPSEKSDGRYMIKSMKKRGNSSYPAVYSIDMSLYDSFNKNNH